MSTGYSWEGIRQVCATLLGARHVYLSALVVATSILGALYQVLDLYLTLYKETSRFYCTSFYRRRARLAYLCCWRL